MQKKGQIVDELAIEAIECTVTKNTYGYVRIGNNYVQTQDTWFISENGYEFSLRTSSPDYRQSNIIPIIPDQKVVVFSIGGSKKYYFCFYNFSTNAFHRLISPGFLVSEGDIPYIWKRRVPFYMRWLVTIYSISIFIIIKIIFIMDIDINMLTYFSIQFILLVIISFFKFLYVSNIETNINKKSYGNVFCVLKNSYNVIID